MPLDTISLDDKYTRDAGRVYITGNQALVRAAMMQRWRDETSGLMQTQKMATLFDGISRHSPEGIAFKQRVETVGWKQAVEERDNGSFDWTKNQPI